jgi:dihydropteroate synthase
MSSEINSGDSISDEGEYEALLAELKDTYAQMREEGAALPAHELGAITRGMESTRLDRAAGSISSIIRVLDALETIKTS